MTDANDPLGERLDLERPFSRKAVLFRHVTVFGWSPGIRSRTLAETIRRSLGRSIANSMGSLWTTVRDG